MDFVQLTEKTPTSRGDAWLSFWAMQAQERFSCRSTDLGGVDFSVGDLFRIEGDGEVITAFELIDLADLPEELAVRLPVKVRRVDPDDMADQVVLEVRIPVADADRQVVTRPGSPVRTTRKLASSS